MSQEGMILGLFSVGLLAASEILKWPWLVPTVLVGGMLQPRGAPISR